MDKISPHTQLLIKEGVVEYLKRTCQACGHRRKIAFHKDRVKYKYETGHCEECKIRLGKQASEIVSTSPFAGIPDAFFEMLFRLGPDCIMIDSEQYVLKSKAPKELQWKGSTRIKVIFIRDDKWTLGAPMELALDAYGTFPGQWRGVIQADKGDDVLVPKFWYDTWRKEHPDNG